MSHVEPWAAACLQTLAACLGTQVRALDLSDARLAQALDYLSDDAAWQQFERQLNEHTLRVYDLRPQGVRTETPEPRGLVSVWSRAVIIARTCRS